MNKTPSVGIIGTKGNDMQDLAMLVFAGAQKAADKQEFYIQLLGVVGAFAAEHLGGEVAETLFLLAAQSIGETEPDGTMQ